MKKTSLYPIADSLDVTLELDGVKVRGEGTHKIKCAGLVVSVPLRIVSSAHFRYDVALIARSIGSLGLFVTYEASIQAVSIGLLDCEKLASEPEGLLEDAQPKSLIEAHAYVLDAEIAAFVRKDGKWLPDED